MVQNILNQIGEVIGDIIGIIPELLAFLVILVVGYFIAKGLQRLTDAALERIGFDNWVERGGVGRAMERSKYDASSLLAITVYYAAMLFVLQFAFAVFGPNPASAIINDIIAYLPNIFAAIVIVVIGAAIAAAVRDVVDAALGGLSYGSAVATGASAAILVVTAFAAVAQLNIAPLIVTGLFYGLVAAVVGIAIVAIGGSGIRPMQEYWRRALNRAEAEAPQVREEAQGANERVKERTEQRRQQAQEVQSGGGGATREEPRERPRERVR